jgi:hypothetical protein
LLSISQRGLRLALLDRRDRRALLALQDRRASLVMLACKVQRVQLVQPEQREPRATLEASARKGQQAWRVPLVPRGRRDRKDQQA